MDSLLDRAQGVFIQAYHLYQECEAVFRDLPRIRDETRIGQCNRAYRELVNVVTSLGNELAKPPDGFEEISRCFMLLADALRTIRRRTKHDCDALLEAWPELNSFSTKGREAIARYRELNQPDDFSFLVTKAKQAPPDDEMKPTRSHREAHRAYNARIDASRQELRLRKDRLRLQFTKFGENIPHAGNSILLREYLLNSVRLEEVVYSFLAIGDAIRSERAEACIEDRLESDHWRSAAQLFRWAVRGDKCAGSA